jgi:cytochrome c
VAIPLACLPALSAALSLVHPWGDLRHVEASGPILAGSTIPANIRATIETKCADCHSDRTHWPVYSRLAPGSWLMEHDVHGARTAMNLSQWDQIPAEGRIEVLTRIAAEARSGQMPPAQYAFMHPANRLTDEEKQEIASWARLERKRLRAVNQEKETNGQ